MNLDVALSGGCRGPTTRPSVYFRSHLEGFVSSVTFPFADNRINGRDKLLFGIVSAVFDAKAPVPVIFADHVDIA